MLDLIQYYFGPIQSAKGFASNQANLNKVPDSVSAVFLFDSGIHGIGAWNFSTHEQIDRTEIVGSKGKITFSTFSDAPVSLEVGGEMTTIDCPNPDHVQQPLIQSIVDELTGIGKCQSTGTTAAETNYWIDHLMDDAKSF
jgi:1,5-anhydro-D-fructose reductase (1,5-anhydro-D-mannitol-forming)